MCPAVTKFIIILVFSMKFKIPNLTVTEVYKQGDFN